MTKKIKARFSNGKFEPLESWELEEGKEVVISVDEVLTEAEWHGLKRRIERKAKEAGITSEEQVDELVHEQRLRSS